jgi:hypothetical protein
MKLKNEAGHVVNAPSGFSFTMFFFGFFVPLFRGDAKWAMISFVVGFITFGISWLIFPFVYNGIYINELKEKGYKEVDSCA